MYNEIRKKPIDLPMVDKALCRYLRHRPLTLFVFLPSQAQSHPLYFRIRPREGTPSLVGLSSSLTGIQERKKKERPDLYLVLPEESSKCSER